MKKTEVIDAIEYLKQYKTETNKIEVKSALNGFPKKCYDTISAFSNKDGGLLIFGINESNGFSIDGVYDLNDLQKQVTALCTNSLEPKIRPDILALEYEGKNILAVKIEELEQNKKPCYYKPLGLKKGSYTRVGDRDEVMTDYEIYSIMSYNEHIFEDTRINRRATLDDLDMDELKAYVEKVKERKPNFAKNSFEKCLELCGIVAREGDEVYPTLAGIMLFCEYAQMFYPQLFIACVVVPGYELGNTSELGERFVDNKRVDGTIEQMLQGAINFLNRNMRTSVIFNYGKRTDRQEYPIEALREAIMNALIHRDYSFQTEGSYISLYMYKDRLEIISPGSLYGAIKLDKLESPNNMETRNPTIIRILEEKTSLIENRHSGVRKMREDMISYGLPEPEFIEGDNYFKVIFRNDYTEEEVITSGDEGNLVIPSTDTKTSQAEQKTGTQQEKNRDTIDIEQGHNINITGTQQEYNRDTNDTEQGHNNDTTGTQITKKNVKNKVLEYCVVPRTAKEIREYINMTSKTYVAANIIKPLVDSGLLECTNKNNIHAKNQKYITKK